MSAIVKDIGEAGPRLIRRIDNLRQFVESNTGTPGKLLYLSFDLYVVLNEYAYATFVPKTCNDTVCLGRFQGMEIRLHCDEDVVLIT